MQKRLAYLIVAVLFLPFSSASVLAQPVEVQDAESIHFNSTVVDGHSDTMMNVIDEETWLPVNDIGEETSFHLDIPKAQAGGIDAPFFAAYTTGYYDNNPRTISRTLALINALHWTEEQNPDDFNISSTTKEIRQTVRKNKIAAIPTIEGAYSLQEHNALGLLHQYNDLGVKVLGFNWNYSNALGEGADRVYGDPEKTPSEGGLTELGAEVAREMNDIGMAIDVSHMSRNTFFDVLEVTDAPVIASHSGVNAVKAHQRNLTDEQLQALKENGGLINIVFYPTFLTNDESGSVEDIVNHIDHAVDLIGIDHVGLGSDFDGASMPEDLQNAAEMPGITEELVNRGYSSQEIEKLLGGNALRVLKEVEKAAENDPSHRGVSPVVKPEYEMGETINTRTPLLQADIETKKGAPVDEDSFKVIVDGIAYEPDYNKKTSTLSLQLSEELQERFHVVTFEAENRAGKLTRETRIFYIDD
ncbi:dipeptidase [Lentibacillus amyloliquefaciens]|uniref:Membrane dipeptidase n=1 Tax=Lentibacillus amyloliquefaciens TaxID=1472767 RepID=A0A0U4G818_9BACI|nr:dipeptidase [Lentibacillus amyloliquefaciens]ALX48858.1 membrane dipeptidase [Lentibacillus amyloliquefaciens]